MTSATAGVIKFLSGELDAARDEAQKSQGCPQCKPMIRNLAGQYDAEDEEARFEKELKDYDAGFRAYRALFARGEIKENDFLIADTSPPGRCHIGGAPRRAGDVASTTTKVYRRNPRMSPLAAAPAPAADMTLGLRASKTCSSRGTGGTGGAGGGAANNVVAHGRLGHRRGDERDGPGVRRRHRAVAPAAGADARAVRLRLQIIPDPRRRRRRGIGLRLAVEGPPPIVHEDAEGARLVPQLVRPPKVAAALRPDPRG